MISRSLRALWQHFLTDTLFRNSIYLMITTGIMGFFGFFFWIICTHIFTPNQIGLGTTLISAMSLISFISLLGFNTTLVRFLPSSQNRNNDINTGTLLVTGAAALIATIYVLVIPSITPTLDIVQQNFWYSALFVLMVTIATINSLTDSIFIAYRSAHFNLLTNGFITSSTKLVLPVVLASLGAYGVFASVGLASTIGVTAGFIILFFKFNYRPRLRIDISVLKKVFRYSFTNYLSNLINIIPTLILPIIIIDHLGAAAAGYYYLAFMIINLLYTVSGSVSQSLFAEGSYAESALYNLIKRSLIILVAIMVPAGLVLALFGPWVLNIFGKSYSAGGGDVIAILAIAAPAVAAYNLGNTILKIRQQMYSVFAISVVYSLAISGLTLYWVDKGLIWVAIAWTVGNAIAAIFAFIAIYTNRHAPTPVAISQ